MALSLVLKHDGLKLLCMIRLCPLPYSISNGAMSTFDTVKPLTFTLATALVTPKLLIHIFIGTRLAAIAKSGEKMDAMTKAINWGSIIVGAIIGALTGFFIYKRCVKSFDSAGIALISLEQLSVHGNSKKMREPTPVNQLLEVERSPTMQTNKSLLVPYLEMIKSIFLIQKPMAMNIEMSSTTMRLMYLVLGMREKEPALSQNDNDFGTNLSGHGTQGTQNIYGLHYPELAMKMDDEAFLWSSERRYCLVRCIFTVA